MKVKKTRVLDLIDIQVSLALKGQILALPKSKRLSEKKWRAHYVALFKSEGLLK